ncbi:hypothetical protein U27_01432 [Candidatus Vecturithrix granuli]|uniref:Uncharacterized protein n=1 Tax=Vecturithrix granuli TaxID=1499967 RepID=A0A081CAC6_VECG1|nr:hypothetical protein U27_01432 [Candidatus Vecturithrix granuli]
MEKIVLIPSRVLLGFSLHPHIEKWVIEYHGFNPFQGFIRVFT